MSIEAEDLGKDWIRLRVLESRAGASRQLVDDPGPAGSREESTQRGYPVGRLG